MVSHGSEHVMGQCDHEEADTRIVVHVRHALERGAESVLVRTVDTDVVVILVGKLHDLLAYNYLCKVWVAFGMGLELYQSSMPSLGVTVLRSSVVLKKRQRGEHGN